MIKTKELLSQWRAQLSIGQCASTIKAKNCPGGLLGRIKRTKGQVIVFDITTYTNQVKIQTSLCKELPQWADLIKSQPTIMDGFAWTRQDYIYLYYSYFHMVVEKLRRIVESEISNE
ncbi:hypothetical protein LCGC14_0140910 [marine sediment metagenome]|uniref:Uncharacterized protein n=1 Tax=marine sediment metagenome TaxID=412755 RepID=A0A0F9V0V7_9ZZZZ